MVILLIVIALLVILVIGIYNGLVSLKVQCDNAWSDIDVQLKRRYDLIPNVVETVKGYAAHEKDTLEGVVAARNHAMTAKAPLRRPTRNGAHDCVAPGVRAGRSLPAASRRRKFHTAPVDSQPN